MGGHRATGLAIAVAVASGCVRTETVAYRSELDGARAAIGRGEHASEPA